MKKLISILFVLAIAMPMLLPVWFLIRQQALREQAKEKLKTSLSQTIRVEKNQLTWVKPGKEIRTNGHLFDVKEISDRGDYYEVTGLYDQQEDILHQQLNHWQQKQNKEQNKLLSAVLLQLFCGDVKETEPLPVTERSAVLFNEFRNLRLSAPFISRPLPPPDAC